MKIIDIETRGNLVRLYLGEDDLDTWWGDDWDDTPYEHNAGRVYDKFVIATKEVAIPWNYVVLEPEDDWHNDGNSEYCKEDMRDRKVPALIVLGFDHEADRDFYENDFGNVLANDSTIRVYLGDADDVLDDVALATVLSERNLDDD